MNPAAHLLVTGASGALGRLVCMELAVAGPALLRAASRQPDALAALAARGVEVRHVDFDHDDTLDSAFAGVTHALIISTDSLAIAGQRQRQHAAALAAARRHGVRHVAYTSMPDPLRATAIPFAADHAHMEQALRDSGLAWTSLRNSWYQENLLGYLPQIVRDGVWYTAAGQGRIAYVARADAAAAAAAALAREDGLGEIDIAGPQALTVEEIAAVVSATLARPLRVVHVNSATLRLELSRQGVDSHTVPLVAMTEATQKDGHFDIDARAAASLLGRPLRTLETFVREHAGLLLG